MSQTEGAERILAKLVAWGAAREDLRAIAVVGSRAREDHPADPWSDLDVIVVARRLERAQREGQLAASADTNGLGALVVSTMMALSLRSRAGARRAELEGQAEALVRLVTGVSEDRPH